MNWLLRTLAVIVVSGAVAHGTAQACIGELACTKTADVTEISSYPATVTYTVAFTYSYANDRCAIAALSDSLLPPDYFSLPTDLSDPNVLWVWNPPEPTQTKTYQLTISSFEQCAALGSPVQADGSVKLTGVLTATPFFADPFTCQQDIVCRPPGNGAGCTLTPGYWKTHSEFGPAAPYDDAWATLPNGASTPFFATGKTYFEVLWSGSSDGAYFTLARAYIAATLNVTGASAPDEVSAAIAWAKAFFTANGSSIAVSKEQRGLVLAYAGLLDNYNNGYIGPGHCE